MARRVPRFLSAGFALEPGATAQRGDEGTTHLSVCDLERGSPNQPGTGSRQNKPGVRTLLRQSLLFSVPRHLSAPQGCVGPRGEALMAGGRRPSMKVTPAGPETWAETQRCRRPVRPSGAHVCHKGLQETNVDCLSARQATSS